MLQYCGIFASYLLCNHCSNSIKLFKHIKENYTIILKIEYSIFNIQWTIFSHDRKFIRHNFIFFFSCKSSLLHSRNSHLYVSLPFSEFCLSTSELLCIGDAPLQSETRWAWVSGAFHPPNRGRAFSKYKNRDE